MEARSRRPLLLAALVLTSSLAGCASLLPGEDDEGSQRFDVADAAHAGQTAVVAFLDGDDKLDLAVANGSRLALGFGDGEGIEVADEPAFTACPSCPIVDVEAGDLDRDNRTDLALLVEDEGLVVLPGRDEGGFGEAHTVPADGGTALALADADNDGWLDAFLGTGSALLLAGNANGTLEDPREVREGAVSSFGLFFLDGDMLLDLFVAGPDGVGLLQNGAEGNGTFAPVQAALGLATTAWEAVVPADLDNDQRVDLVLAGPEKLVVLWNEGQRELAVDPSPGRGLERAVTSAVPADVDNDGWQDLAVLTDGGLSVLANDNGTAFEPAQDPTGPSGEALAVLDPHRDGNLDALVLDEDGSRWLANRGGEAHSFQMRLKGNRSNPTGIGVKVTLTTGTALQLRQTGGVGSPVAVEAPSPHFGLGTEPADEYGTALLWPSGILQFERTPAERVVDSHLVAFEHRSRAPWAEC